MRALRHSLPLPAVAITVVLALCSCAPGPDVPASPGASHSSEAVAVLTASRWRELAPLPVAAVNAAFAATENGVYAAGGIVNGVPSNAAWRYDRASDKWTELPPMPTARQYAAAVVGPDKRLYVIGGSDMDTLHVPVMEVYDPHEDAWISSVEAYSSWAPGAAVDGDGIVVAGDAHVQRYDIADGSWAEVGNYVEDILGVINLVEHPSKRIVLYGAGHFRWLDEAVRDSGILVKSPERRDFAGLAAGPDGRFYEIGGQPLGGGEAIASVHAFDPSTAEWGSAPRLPEPLGFVRASTLGESILVLGPSVDESVTKLYELPFVSEPGS